MTYDSVHSSNDVLYNMIRVLARQKSGLKIVHINAQSLNNKMDEFRHNFSLSEIDIICVSETWFSPKIQDSIYELPGYNLFRADRETNGGGVCIYIRRGIKCKVNFRSDSNSGIEYIFLDVSTGKEDKILVGCVYRPNKHVSIDDLLTILQSTTMTYNDIFIAGDLNSNLLLENYLSDAFLSLGLYPINTTIPTHFHQTCNTLLDVFFVSQLSKVVIYDQLSAPMFSKHDLIFVTYETAVNVENETITYRNFNKINYGQLNDLVDNIEWDLLYSIESVDDQTNFLQSNINYVYNICVPLTKKCIKYSQPPWFNNDIRHAIVNRDNVYKRWKRFKTGQLHDLFKSARKHVVCLISSAKSAYYQHRFKSAIDSKSKWREIRKIGIGKTVKNCDDINVDELNALFVGDNMPSGMTNYYSEYNNVKNVNEFSFCCVEQHEVARGINKIKSNAIGTDELHPRFLKIIFFKILPHLTYVFNSILTKSIFPAAWKKAKIIPVPKSNKGLRPIAILPFLSKVLENIMCCQMNNYINENELLSHKQSGFRQNRSCITALTDVVENIRSNMDENRASFLVLLDHSKAFDTVNHEILLTKLDKFFNFSNTACKLISSYLNNRTQIVFHNKITSNPLNVDKGVPQGSILGPLLFCIYINDLTEVLRYCNVQIYADDVQIYISEHVDNLNLCVDNLNADLENISSWAFNNGLCINPTKSKCIFISKRGQSQNINFCLKINSAIIEVVKHAKNLGVIFNDELTWSTHINATSGKVHGMLRNLWAVQTSTPPQIRMLLAKTYLIPTLLYGSEIFENCNCTDLQKLNVTYNNIARYVFNKKRYDRISYYSYKLFNVTFTNYLKYKSLSFLHKIIYTKEPKYLFETLQFSRSNRGKKIIQIRFRSARSERQFFIPAVRSWNTLPSCLQTISNAHHFKKELLNFLK